MHTHGVRFLWGAYARKAAKGRGGETITQCAETPASRVGVGHDGLHELAFEFNICDQGIVSGEDER
jgi:hypothetical protein